MNGVGSWHMHERRPGDWRVLAAVIALHGVALSWLTQPSQPPQAPMPPQVLAATLIQAPAPRSVPALPRAAAVTPPMVPATPLPQLASTAEPADTAPVADPAPLPEAAADEALAPAEPAAVAAETLSDPILPPDFEADYLDNPAPVYPRISRRLREEGLVLLRVHVNAGGAPSQVELKQSSGHPRLDEAARDTVWRWRFLPARQGGAAVAGWVVVPISFALRS